MNHFIAVIILQSDVDTLVSCCLFNLDAMLAPESFSFLTLHRVAADPYCGIFSMNPTDQYSYLAPKIYLPLFSHWFKNVSAEHYDEHFSCYV